MSNSVSSFLTPEQTSQAIDNLKYKFTYSFDHKKHRIVFETGENLEIFIRLPLPFSIENYQSLSEDIETPYIICLIQSGSAALALCEGFQVVEHKVFKAYMVRKKQGKSQLKYLKTKGKSKAGSRVRLGNTTHFFEEINEKLADWLSYFEIEKIALSLNKTLYPYLFNDNNLILRKDDPRIYKIPKHIEEPSFEKLLSTHSYLSLGEINYPENQKNILEPILKT